MMGATLQELEAHLHAAYSAALPTAGRGRVATYIPALAGVNPQRLGVAVASLEGKSLGLGDSDVPFSIQSISKAFSLALVLARDGEDLWKRVGKEPSGTPFNSLVQLEHEQGLPRNPFMNAGALVVTDRLLTLTGDARGAVRDFLRRESGNPRVDFDAEVARSEAEHGFRNAALANFIASYGRLENPVEKVLEHYFWQCSLAMSCTDLARACGFLARHGQLRTGERFLTRSQAKQINAIMLTCGTYDAAGEFAYRVGLPGKSGVGGGIVAVIPNRFSVCVWGPALDDRGNSVAGVELLDQLMTRTGLSIF